MNPAQTYRQNGRKRKRAGSRYAAPVAFAGTEDAHPLALNPNAGKRHASRANLNLHSDPAGAQRERLTRNTGRRRMGQRTPQPYLETWNATRKASVLSKRPVKGFARSQPASEDAS